MAAVRGSLSALKDQFYPGHFYSVHLLPDKAALGLARHKAHFVASILLLLNAGVSGVSG